MESDTQKDDFSYKLNLTHYHFWDSKIPKENIKYLDVCPKKGNCTQVYALLVYWLP